MLTLLGGVALGGMLSLGGGSDFELSVTGAHGVRTVPASERSVTGSLQRSVGFRAHRAWRFAALTFELSGTHLTVDGGRWLDAQPDESPRLQVYLPAAWLGFGLQWGNRYGDELQLSLGPGVGTALWRGPLHTGGATLAPALPEATLTGSLRLRHRGTLGERNALQTRFVAESRLDLHAGRYLSGQAGTPRAGARSYHGELGLEWQGRVNDRHWFAAGLWGSVGVSGDPIDDGGPEVFHSVPLAGAGGVACSWRIREAPAR